MCNAGGQLAFSAPPWPGISPEAKSCVSRLLEPDVGRRATPAEILQHPWLVQHGVALLEPCEHVVVQRMRQARFSALAVSQPGCRLSSRCCRSVACSDAALPSTECTQFTPVFVPAACVSVLPGLVSVTPFCVILAPCVTPVACPPTPFPPFSVSPSAPDLWACAPLLAACRHKQEGSSILTALTRVLQCHTIGAQLK